MLPEPSHESPPPQKTLELLTRIEQDLAELKCERAKKSHPSFFKT